MKAPLFEKILSLLDFELGQLYDVLDIGCGSGELLGRISNTIANESIMVGIDSRQKPIDQAAALYPNIDFRHEKFVESLSFSDSAFDTVISVDTLECIPNKTALFGEVARVLRPNGKVLFAHWDWDTQTYNVPSRDLARKAVRAFSDWKQPWMDAADGQMGRKLWGLFEGSGKFHGTLHTYCLVETEYEQGKYGYDRVQDLSIMVAQGDFDNGEYEQLCRELSECSAKGEYIYSVTSFIYHGKKA